MHVLFTKGTNIVSRLQQRIKKLSDVIKAMGSMSKEYREFEHAVNEASVRLNCEKKKIYYDH